MKRIFISILFSLAGIGLAFGLPLPQVGIGASYSLMNEVGVEGSLYNLVGPAGVYGNLEHNLTSEENSKNLGVNLEFFPGLYALLESELGEDFFSQFGVGLEYFVTDNVGLNIRTSTPLEDWKNISLGLKYKL